MKTHTFIIHSLAVLLITAVTASAELASAKVFEVTGTVTKYAASGGQTRLAPGEILKEGDGLTTSPLSSVKLVFSNGSELEIMENSSITINEMKQEPFEGGSSYEQLQADPSQSQTLLELNYGQVDGHVKQLRADSKFHVQTPLGTAAIRGTRWSALLIYNAVRCEFTLTVKNFDGLVDIISRFAGDVNFSDAKTAKKSVTPELAETKTSQLPQDHTIALTISRGDPGFDQLLNPNQNIQPSGPQPVITPAPPTGASGSEDSDLGIIVVSPEGTSNNSQPQ